MEVLPRSENAGGTGGSQGWNVMELIKGHWILFMIHDLHIINDNDSNNSNINNDASNNRDTCNLSTCSYLLPLFLNMNCGLSFRCSVGVKHWFLHSYGHGGNGYHLGTKKT